jgi:hypothetical protein
MRIKELIVNLGIIKDKFKSFISRFFKVHGEIAEIINFFISVIYFAILLFFLVIFGPILIIIETISEMDRSAIFILFIVIATAIYYFNNDTYAMNKKYQCNFDIFFPNWAMESQKLEDQEMKGPPPKSLAMSDQELADAEADIAKEAYLPSKVVREAKEKLEHNNKLIDNWIKYQKINSERIQECRNYINHKKEVE